MLNNIPFLLTRELLNHTMIFLNGIVFFLKTELMVWYYALVVDNSRDSFVYKFSISL